MVVSGALRLTGKSAGAPGRTRAAGFGDRRRSEDAVQRNVVTWRGAMALKPPPILVARCILEMRNKRPSDDGHAGDPQEMNEN